MAKPYTPEFAAKISGLDAKDIERIAIEFASKAPHCAAFTNRGSQAHYNGLNNDRSVIMLNAIVGSIGKVVVILLEVQKIQDISLFQCLNQNSTKTWIFN